MSALTSIQWTIRTWNPVRGCSRVSAGCDNCYAMNMAHRFSGVGKSFEGLTTILRGKVDWTGVARFIPGQLAAPLKWRKPARIFVNSMSDLFHPSLSNDEIAAVFGVMAACPQHTFQVLTKQPKRAAEWFKWTDSVGLGAHGCLNIALRVAREPGNPLVKHIRELHATMSRNRTDCPLPNVHLGTSAENQETYNARVPLLVHQCPAAVHFVSIEPMLGPMRLRGTGHLHLDWVIIGGESGPGARPCDHAWIESIVTECRESAIPCFVKQVGSLWYDSTRRRGARGSVIVPALTDWEWAKKRDKKGGDPSEWPESLRVRQFPEARV